jgi:hypothetical protein
MLPYVAGAGGGGAPPPPPAPPPRRGGGVGLRPPAPACTHRRTGGRCSLGVRRSATLRYFAAAQFAAAKSQLASLSKNVCV